MLKYFIFCHVFIKNHWKFQRRRETSTKKASLFFVSQETRFLEEAHRVEKVSFSNFKKYAN